MSERWIKLGWSRTKILGLLSIKIPSIGEITGQRKIVFLLTWNKAQWDDNLMWQPPSDLDPIQDRGQQLEQSGSLCGGWSGIQSSGSVLSLLFHNGWPGQALVLCQDNFIRFTAGRGIYSKHRPSHHTSHMSRHDAARLMWGHFKKNFRKHWCVQLNAVTWCVFLQ